MHSTLLVMERHDKSHKQKLNYFYRSFQDKNLSLQSGMECRKKQLAYLLSKPNVSFYSNSACYFEHTWNSASYASHHKNQIAHALPLNQHSIRNHISSHHSSIPLYIGRRQNHQRQTLFYENLLRNRDKPFYP